MKLATWNVNGIRSIHGKGFSDWLSAENADVVCLQEIKANTEQLEESVVSPPGYHGYWHSAEKPGYSGVAIYTRKEPLNVSVGIGSPDVDREGRVLVAEFKNFTLVNAYFPNSQRDHARLGYKLAFCDTMLAFLESLRDRESRSFSAAITISRTRRSISKIRNRTRKTRDFFPRNAPGSTVSSRTATSILSAFSSRGPATTPGGATGRACARKTSGGAWIISSRRKT